MRVAFLHPDLGIGGAERLIVDAAIALQSKGHHVSIATCYHDPRRCFPETRDGRLPVAVYGDWLPRHLCGSFHALFAYLRMICMAITFALSVRADEDRTPQVIVCDQISACIPFLKLLLKSKILFYCHFPDQLLSARTSFIKSLYRMPIDYIERVTTAMADRVVVNSDFTAAIVQKTFFKSSIFQTKPFVVYPSINLTTFDDFLYRAKSAAEADPKTLFAEEKIAKLSPSEKAFLKDRPLIFLSLNRFERKKNLMLALNAFVALRERLPLHRRNAVKLVIAGGYDERLPENRDYYRELFSTAEKHQLQPIAKSSGSPAAASSSSVLFLQSISDEGKLFWIYRSSALLYTPENEHFGITPLETMYMNRIVIAAKSGGPLETVVHGKTGFLCEPHPQCFATAMHWVALQAFQGEDDRGLFAVPRESLLPDAAHGQTLTPAAKTPPAKKGRSASNAGNGSKRGSNDSLSSLIDGGSPLPSPRGVMTELLADLDIQGTSSASLREMAIHARQRVLDKFSFSSFAQTLHRLILELIPRDQRRQSVTLPPMR